MNSDINQRLIAIVKERPPINYVVEAVTSPDLVRLFREAFSDDSKERRIIDISMALYPGGIIVFGYSDNTSIHPILEILDEISMKYGLVKLVDGREVGFIGHDQAQKLFSPDIAEGDWKPNFFDDHLTLSLKLMAQNLKEPAVLPGGKGSGVDGLIDTLRWLVMDEGMVQEALEAVVARGGRLVHGA